MKWFGIVAAFVAVPAYGQGATVRVVKEQAAVSGCERLSQVRGSSLMGGILAGAAYDSALNEMKEAVSAAGGNHLLLLDLSSGYAGANGFGEAYRCEQMKPTIPATRKRR